MKKKEDPLIDIDLSVCGQGFKCYTPNRTDADVDEKVNNCCMAYCQIPNQYIKLQVKHISPMDCTYCHFISYLHCLSIAVPGSQLFSVLS